jgi:hypothetical protein
MSNLAAWIPLKGAPVEIKPTEIPQPGTGELVIEVCSRRLIKIARRLTVH